MDGECRIKNILSTLDCLYYIMNIYLVNEVTNGNIFSFSTICASSECSTYSIYVNICKWKKHICVSTYVPVCWMWANLFFVDRGSSSSFFNRDLQFRRYSRSRFFLVSLFESRCSQNGHAYSLSIWSVENQWKHTYLIVFTVVGVCVLYMCAFSRRSTMLTQSPAGRLQLFVVWIFYWHHLSEYDVVFF